MEQLGKAGENGVMTFSTRRRRISKQGQILRGGNQIWDRGCMTYCTRAAVNIHNHIGACMTACCTISVNGDRLIIQPTRRVRCMVVVTMALTGFIGMTGGTGVARTRCNYTGYCAGRRVVELTVRAVIIMTSCTVTELVVMQRDNLAPGADRSMTEGTTGSIKNLIRSSIISYIMTTVLTRMEQLAGAEGIAPT